MSRNEEKVLRAKESPLYGSWTRRVIILDGTYDLQSNEDAGGIKDDFSGKELRKSCWGAIEFMLKGLENISKFKINARLPYLKEHIIMVLSYLPQVDDLNWLYKTKPFDTPFCC